MSAPASAAETQFKCDSPIQMTTAKGIRGNMPDILFVNWRCDRRRAMLTRLVSPLKAIAGWSGRCHNDAAPKALAV